MSESAIPFSAVIVRPSSSPVMVMLVRLAPVSSEAADVLARTSVKYWFVAPSSIASVVSLEVMTS